MGDAARALEQCQVLLLDRERELGPKHPDTLMTQHSIAHWTGQTGDAVRALELCQALLPNEVEVLGPNHRETLSSVPPDLS